MQAAGRMLAHITCNHEMQRSMKNASGKDNNLVDEQDVFGLDVGVHNGTTMNKAQRLHHLHTAPASAAASDRGWHTLAATRFAAASAKTVVERHGIPAQQRVVCG